MTSDIKKEWLRAKTSIKDIEKYLGALINLTKDKYWLEFKGKVKKGDEIWKVDSVINDLPLDEQEMGYAIVRKGKIVDSLLF